MSENFFNFESSDFFLMQEGSFFVLQDSTSGAPIIQTNSGFLYYYDLLGLNPDSYRLHYKFTEPSGSVLANSSFYTAGSGVLSSVGDFHVQPGYGYFSGQKVTVQNPTGLAATDWTHLFLFERTDPRAGVLFDSYTTGAIRSGYRIGVNDNNRFYFESYDNNGAVSRTSQTILGNKNCAAVVKNQDLVTFYCFDFNNNTLISDSVDIKGQYTLFSSNIAIGSTRSGTEPFRGYVDEYVYLTEGVNPSALKLLATGLFSDYSLAAPIVSGYQTTGIVGWASGVTGVTGVVRYENVVVGSGTDVFGNPETYYMNSGVTGYLLSGTYLSPVTGVINNFITGDSIPTLTFYGDQLKEYGMNEVSLIRKIYGFDYTALNINRNLGASMNNTALFDSIEGEYQLNGIFSSGNLQLFTNGVFQRNGGYTVTGDFYNSGLKVNDDYYLDGFYAVSKGQYLDTDVIYYDNLSGLSQSANITGSGYSGRVEAITPSTGASVYFNGLKLINNVDYVLTPAFQWKDNTYSGASGHLNSLDFSMEYWTGRYPTNLQTFPRANTQLYLNGQRQVLGVDYMETSSLDLIKQSGIFATGLDSIYNQDNNYFE